MTDWRKLLVDEQLWDYRCKAVPVPLVREIVEEVETLRQDLAAAQARVAELEAENAQILADPMNVGWQRAQDAIKDRAAAVSQWKAYKQRAERAEADLAAKDTTLGEMTALARKAEADLAAARAEREHFKNCISAREVRAMVDERNKAWSDLADARVLLADVRASISQIDNYRIDALVRRIDAALGRK